MYLLTVHYLHLDVRKQFVKVTFALSFKLIRVWPVSLNIRLDTEINCNKYLGTMIILVRVRRPHE